MKRAVALIELIFAIVAIAITLTAIPNLINTTTKASKSAITQEAISNAVSQMDTILSQYWDETDIDPKYNNPILKVSNQNISLQEAFDHLGNLMGRRIGTPLSSPRRYARDLNGNFLRATPASKLGKDSNDNKKPDDVDDYNNNTQKLAEIESTSTELGDYKDKNITMAIKVFYIKDDPTNAPYNYNSPYIEFNNPFDSSRVSNSSTNIKAIKLTLKSLNDPNKVIVFNAFSCNIGAVKLKEKKF